MEEQIKQDLKNALLNRDEVVVSTLRLLISEINNTKIQKNSTDNDLSDQDIVAIIQKETKKRKEAAEGFRTGGREESAQKEETEAAVLEKYLPQQMSDEELTKVVEEVINEVKATSIQDMGRVIGAVMQRISGSADGGRVSLLVKERLTK